MGSTGLESESERGLGFEFFKLLYCTVLVYLGEKGLNPTNRSWDPMVDGENQLPQGFDFCLFHLLCAFAL